MTVGRWQMAGGMCPNGGIRDIAGGGGGILATFYVLMKTKLKSPNIYCKTVLTALSLFPLSDSQSVEADRNI